MTKQELFSIVCGNDFGFHACIYIILKMYKQQPIPIKIFQNTAAHEPVCVILIHVISSHNTIFRLAFY